MHPGNPERIELTTYSHGNLWKDDESNDWYPNYGSDRKLTVTRLPFRYAPTMTETWPLINSIFVDRVGRGPMIARR